MNDRVTGNDAKPGAPTVADLTVTRRDAEVLEVSSGATRGRCATVYKFSFSTNYSVQPFLIGSYMQGISTALILDAVHAYVERESAQKREAAYNAFLGHGCTMPSDAFAVTDEDAEEILELLREADPATPGWAAGGYSICAAEDSVDSVKQDFRFTDKHLGRRSAYMTSTARHARTRRLALCVPRDVNIAT